MDQERTAIFADANAFSAGDSGIGRAPARPRPVARDRKNAQLRALVAGLETKARRQTRRGDPTCRGSAMGGVEASEGVGARAELGLAEPIERRLDGVETLVHIVGIGVDEQEPGDDLAQRVALLKVGQR
jgi:hypothetical protein